MFQCQSWLLSFVVFIFSSYAFSAVERTNKFSLDELLSLKSKVVSKKTETTRETPGVLTIITKDEIQNMGARDLIDVFRMVPGISFNLDVQSAIGMSVRGNWGIEGKILVMINGRSVNELIYGTTLYSGHFPVDQISRIEIQRGAGSAIYGGLAELAVINIIMDSAEDLSGAKVGINYGQMEDSFARRNAHFSYGKKVDDFELTTQFFIGEGNRSDRVNRDFYPAEPTHSYNMKSNSGEKPLMVNFDLKEGNLKIGLTYDKYVLDMRDNFGFFLPETVRYTHENLVTDVEYKFDFEKFNFTTKYTYVNSKPYNSLTADAQLYNQNVNYAGVHFGPEGTRHQFDIESEYFINDWAYLITGIQYHTDKHTNNGPASTFAYNNGIHFNSIGAFFSTTMNTDFANITLGARYDKQKSNDDNTVNNLNGTTYLTQFDSDAFVPRIALTKVWGDFHTKAMYNRSFKAPTLQNIVYSPNIEAEETSTFELEFGYKFSFNSYMAINLYDIKIDKPIIYNYDVNTGLERYLTGNDAGTRGVEWVYRHNFDKLDTQFSLSYYTATDSPNAYKVTKNDNYQKGIPRVKATGQVTYYFSDTMSFTPSLVYLGKKYGLVDLNNQGEFDENWLLNLYFRDTEFFAKNLEFGFGVANALNEDYRFINANDNANGPQPDGTTEAYVKLTYYFDKM